MKQMINKILHRVKESSLAKKTEIQDRDIEYKSLKELKSCLVFWVAEAGEDQESVKTLLQQLKVYVKKVDKLCFVMKDADVRPTDDTVFVQNEDLGFGGKIQHDCLLDMLKVKYDILIDLSRSSNPMIDYILKNSQAKCKVGMTKEGFEADFIIDEVNTPAGLVANLLPVLAKLPCYN